MVQIIIYAGAIMVLFLFTVMLLNVPREDARRVGSLASAAIARWPMRIGGVLAVLLALELGWALSRTTGLGGRRRRRGARRSSSVRSSAGCCSPITCSRSK